MVISLRVFSESVSLSQNTTQPHAALSGKSTFAPRACLRTWTLILIGRNHSSIRTYWERDISHQDSKEKT